MRHLFALLLLLAGLSNAHAQALAPPPAPGLKTAVFAGGCFWCMVGPFQQLPGVTQVIAGYTGGTVVNPTYEQVSSGRTGHTEAVRVTYDPTRIGFAKLLDVFWRNIDPLDAGGQFCDRGKEYASGIFAADAEQRGLAETGKQAVEVRLGKPPVTPIVDAAPFYAAEDYHQDYHLKNPIKYKFYRTTCGRDSRLRQVWGDEAGGRQD
ncbi:MAG: peptide-methionine (S)-S-oxide reductase MsrA [Gemmatimonadaceae bacterium]|nr:peptide-methionine (S)-S-oxide reductase MsrA [Acetobacteraceae bacterium]